LLIPGLYNLPEEIGHNPPNILNNDDFPHPLGPVTIQFIPGYIYFHIIIYITSKDILFARISLLGEIIGISSNLIVFSVSIIYPLFIDTNDCF